MINKVAISKNKPKTFRLPYLSAMAFDKPIPTIIKMMPPALNKPNPAETGSFPKKLIPTQELDKIYEENSNLYIFSKESFLSTSSRIGKNPILFETPKNEAE